MSEYQVTLYRNGDEQNTAKAENLYHLMMMVQGAFLLCDREGNIPDKIIIEDITSKRDDDK